MPDDILFISKSNIAEFYDLVGFIADNKVKPHIRRAQTFTIRAKICEPLYNEIQEQLKNDLLSSSNDLLLCKYIRPYHSALAFQTYLVFANANSTKSGYMAFTGENEADITPAKLSSLISFAQQDAGLLETLLVNFLADHTDEYPLYDNCNCHTPGEFRGMANNFGFTAIGGKINKSPFNNIRIDHDDHHFRH